MYRPELHLPTPRDRVERRREDLVALADRGHDVRTFSEGVARILRRAVPFDCFSLVSLDPATLLPTEEVAESCLPADVRSRMAEIEVAEDDFNKFPELARSKRPAATLSEATDGRLDRSLRHRDILGPNGFGDELRVGLVGDSAVCGGLTLLRGQDAPDFTPSETRVLADLSPQIAEGLRRAVVQAFLSAAEPEHVQDTGVILLEHDNTIASANPAAAAWIEELEEASSGQPVPGIVAAVASRAREFAASGTVAEARVRFRTSSGSWLSIHASVLGEGADTRCVVVLDPAGADEIAPMIADAYGLTDREREVTQLVAQGLSTSAISERLDLSPWTVQDHLKSIFEKTGAGTRGELVARVFFEHYAPRLAAER